MTLAAGEQRVTFERDPFETIKMIIKSCALPMDQTPLLEIPVMAGLFGYLSYDLKDAVEELPKTAIDDQRLPDLYLAAPGVLLAHDIKEAKTTLCIP